MQILMTKLLKLLSIVSIFSKPCCLKLGGTTKSNNKNKNNSCLMKLLLIWASSFIYLLDVVINAAYNKNPPVGSIIILIVHVW